MAAQSPTPPPKPTVTIPGPDGGTRTLLVPSTQSEVEALLAQREELGEQLTSVASRRASLSEQIRNAPEGPSRTGLEERIRVIDQRILQLETDLAATGRQLALAPPQLMSSIQMDHDSGGGDEFEEGLLAGSFFTLWLVPIAVLYARRRWKKKFGASPPRVQAESNPRMERIEQGVEAIAIEIERISEGQRFLTKLLAESPASPAAIERGK